MAQGKKDDLEAFAKRIETRVKAGGATDSMERLICRLMTNGKTPQIGASLAMKWVEWRYGKPKENVKIEQTTRVEITVSDADRIIREAFDATAAGPYTFSGSDSGQETQQDKPVLPS